MLKLEQDIKRKFIGLFLVTFMLIFVSAYLFVKELLLKSIHDTALLAKIMQQYNIIWLEIGVIFLLLFSLSYYIVNTLSKKILQDVQAKETYLEEINNKKYDAVIKIENYVEFLKMSLLLKNIVKRLKQKEKKASKK
ncbi:hypothetical protein [Sulfurimonas sp.]